MNSETRILEPGQIEAPAGEIRFVFLPDRDLFSRRATRLRLLSENHSLGDYLAFLALLADAQQAALNRFPTLSTPGPREQALCREHGMPLLAAGSWTRNPAWRGALTMILQQIGVNALPTPTCKTIAGLLRAKETRVEEMADKILAGDLDGISPGELPFVAAALQVYWVQMASALEEQ
ncbi:MAG: formate dehydrogenase accessory protein FdhE, partial [Desulfuromonadaceae bacterium]